MLGRASCTLNKKGLCVLGRGILYTKQEGTVCARKGHLVH